ncbi:hypothetical protein CERZMDRAFT_96314 [Cercospora zeae-maydis SCOH1-5]|uniref:Uncharacterized protein n=1 Tax=Cercospora zeae-maydis SCOH1-5 TaxID=717836 RepID=A0A6A6FJ78_9PEZI|nr:hypothetical protein CERZMDRAFT_96314 [Cercospora zeae-maydis SCOH1-5]
MSVDQRLGCIKSIGLYYRELPLLQFPVFGSLYLTSSAPVNAVRLDDHFCVGPLTAPYYWGRGLEQSAAIEPAFVFASVDPDFAQELSNDVDDKDASEEDRALNVKFRKRVASCVEMWAVAQQFIEKIAPTSRLHPSVLRVLAAPSQGWTDQVEALKWLLNDLAKRWDVLELPGESAYQPEQTGEVAEKLDEIEAIHRLKGHLTDLLRCGHDGWVSSDRWKEVLARYRLEYSRFVESVVESEECKTEEDKVKAVEKANRLWPFDQR